MIERRVHWLLQDSRIDGEWFKVSAPRAVKAVRQAADENGQGDLARPATGRPALGVKQTIVRLTPEQRRRIEALVGPNKMAVFIREAVENELRRREEAESER